MKDKKKKHIGNCQNCLRFYCEDFLMDAWCGMFAPKKFARLLNTKWCRVYYSGLWKTFWVYWGKGNGMSIGIKGVDVFKTDDYV